MSAADLGPMSGRGTFGPKRLYLRGVIGQLCSFHHVGDLNVVSNALTCQPRQHMVRRVVR